MSELELLESSIRAEFPKYKRVPKEGSRLMWLLDLFLRIVSLGKLRFFLSRFVTTIGTVVYTPTTWNDWAESGQVRVLKHELVHMRQRRRWGTAIYTISYLFLPFPVGLAWCRTRFEQEAYEVSMQDLAERFGVEVLTLVTVRESFIKLFTGADYLWMWPFRKQVERWYDTVVQKLRVEQDG